MTCHDEQSTVHNEDYDDHVICRAVVQQFTHYTVPMLRRGCLTVSKIQRSFAIDRQLVSWLLSCTVSSKL